MRSFTEIETDINEVRSKSLDNYSYKYWRGNENGMSLDAKMNEEYGEDREGYERYKSTPWELPDGSLSEPGQIDCSYAGVTSLRTITNRKNDEVVGYVTETKKSMNPHRDLANKLFEEIYEWILVKLNVQDKEAFKYYYIQHKEYGIRDTIGDIILNVEWLKEMYRMYHDDDDYKKFIDKIIS